MTEGWIKLHRKFKDWEWRQDPNMVALFIHILLNANHKQKRWKGVLVERGQMVTGLRSLSANTGISIRSLRTCLERLKSTQEVTIKTTHNYTIITVTKWDTYQFQEHSTDTVNDTQNDIQPTQYRHSTDNKQEGEKEKNIKNIFIPPTLEQLTEYCKERRNSVDPCKWLDHYTAKGWMIGKNKMKDWKAAVRTWEKPSNGTKKHLDPIERLKKEMNLDNRADA